MPDRPAQYTVDEFIETVEYVEGVLSRDPFDETQRTFAAATLRDALRQMRRASGLADSPPRLRAVPPDGDTEGAA